MYEVVNKDQSFPERYLRCRIDSFQCRQLDPQTILCLILKMVANPLGPSLLDGLTKLRGERF